jgi:urease accessory protein
MKTKMKQWKRYAALGVAMLVLTPATALAHREAGQAAGFLSGFEHPISGLDHVLAMIAVGLWGASNSRSNSPAPVAN